MSKTVEIPGLFDVVAEGLALAILAPSDELANDIMQKVMPLSLMMDELELKRAQKRALEIVDEIEGAMK